VGGSDNGTAGGYNTAVGYAALAINTGSGNTAVGKSALSANLSGNENSAFGGGALTATTTGESNSAFGKHSLYSNLTGGSNAAFGQTSLYSNTTGSANSAFGQAALSSATTASYNSAFGMYSLYSSATGGSNSAVGAFSLRYLESGQANSVLGNSALTNLRSGSGNIGVGANSGYALIEGNNNIYIGSYVDGTANESSTIRIGRSADHSRVFIAGAYGVNVSASIGQPVYIGNDGQLGTFNSSRRYKEDIRPIDNSAELVEKLSPVSFRYKKAQADGTKPLHYGLIAEEVEGIAPELVVYNAEGQVESVAYQMLIPILLDELKRQQQINSTQAAEIDRLMTLEKEVRELKALLKSVARSGKN
jgi:hypothetical protein